MADELKLGHIIDPTRDVHRDATHVAVVPMTASVVLLPGNRVNAEGLPLAPHVGIVDPFLDCIVKAGERFWCYLFPGTVTGMRHEWQHPAFPTTSVVAPPPATLTPTIKTALQHQSDSETWLRKFADSYGMSFEDLLDAADQYAQHGNATVQHGSQQWRDDFYGHEKDFWHHYEIFRGVKVKDRDGNPFCCTC